MTQVPSSRRTRGDADRWSNTTLSAATRRAGRRGAKTADASTHLRVVDTTEGPEELSDEILGRLHAYAVALSAREVTPKSVANDWPAFFDLTLVFVERHGSTAVQDAVSRTSVFNPERRHAQRGALTTAERRCFMLLARDLRSFLVKRPA